MQNQTFKLLATSVLTAGLSLAASAQSIQTLISFPSAVEALAANPVTNKIYAIVPTVGGGPTDSLAVIDGKSNTLIQELAVPSGAAFVAVNYFTNAIYVAGCNYNTVPSPCTVVVIDGRSNKTTVSIPITSTPGLGLTGIVVNPLNGQVYVANANDNVIDIITGYRNKVTGTISLNGNSPAALAINPFLDLLYVPFGTNQTAVVSILKSKILSITNFGASTVGAAVNLLDGNVFVTDQEFGPSMTGVLKANGTLLASITVDDSPLGVDVDPFTNLVFVASTALDQLDVIDGSTNTFKTSVANVPAEYVAVNIATEKVYVSGRTGITVVTEK